MDKGPGRAHCNTGQTPGLPTVSLNRALTQPLLHCTDQRSESPMTPKLSFLQICLSNASNKRSWGTLQLRGGVELSIKDNPAHPSSLLFRSGNTFHPERRGPASGTSAVTHPPSGPAQRRPEGRRGNHAVGPSGLSPHGAPEARSQRSPEGRSPGTPRSSVQREVGSAPPLPRARRGRIPREGSPVPFAPDPLQEHPACTRVTPFQVTSSSHPEEGLFPIQSRSTLLPRRSLHFH